MSDVGNVEGTVTDASTGKSLLGATVKIGDKSTDTDNNGVYSISELAVGSRTITATKTGYQTYSNTIDIDKGTTVTNNIQLTSESGSDTVAPSNTTASNFINKGETSTNSISATLALSATDNIGVTGYYASETGTTPSASATGWTAVTSTTSYSATVAFTLSGGSGTKTVYVWFRDSAGNVSASTNDSIILTVSDTTAPTSASISINNGDTSTTSTAVTLALSAMDNAGVTGYCAIESSTTPSSNDSCWTAITSTATYSATVSFILSSGSIGNNTKTVYVWFRDTAGNVSASVSDSIDLIVSDTTAPSSPSVSIDSGVASTTSTSVTLNLSAIDDVGVTAYYTSETGTTPSASATGWTAVTSITSYSATVNFTLSSGSVGNNTKTVYVWFKDAAGNVSASANDSITLIVSDTTAPSSPSVSIDSGVASTTSTAVTLTLSATDDVGVTAYYASETQTTPTATSGWTTITSSTTSYSATVSFPLSSGSVGNNTKTVYVWFKDAAGNKSADGVYDSINLIVSDTTAPSTTISNFINSGATSTAITSATLALSATDDVGITGYCAKELSTTPASNDSCWTSVTSTTSYSATVSFTLSSGSVGNNTKTVYVWFKDAAGNKSADGVSDTIILTVSDTTAPSSPSISINNGDVSTTNPAVILDLSATDDVGVTAYYTSETQTTPTATSGWTTITSSTTTYSATVSFALSSGSVGNNTKTVYVWFKDAAGNVSASASDSINLIVSDSTAPSSPSVSINSGAASTTSTSVTLTLSATDNVGVTAYYASETSTTPLATVTGWAAYSSSVNFTLISVDGTKTVYVWFKDAAGNVSSPASDSITLDTTAPTVNSTSPANSATGVAISTTITATFSETMDASTITTSTFTLSGGVTGAVTYSGTTATFTPSSSLSSSTTYTVTITTVVKDSAGNAIAGNYTWQFTTEPIWSHKAYLKAPNAGANDQFGWSVAVDVDTVVVGAVGESSNQTTITNGTGASTDNSLGGSGAVYVFKRSGANWSQEAYLKASNAGALDRFGQSVAVNADTVVVGAYGEDSSQTTITNGTTASADNSASGSGAAYVFKRSGTTWAQEAYLKAPNAGADDNFGYSVAVNADTVVVGAPFEDSNQTTITNGTTASADNSAAATGAAYVFKRSGANWAQEAYLKAPNAETTDWFGLSVAVDADTVVAGAYAEDSNQTTITNGTTASTNNSASSSGAAYVFKRSGTTWSQEAYLKAPNAETEDWFGQSVAVNADTVVVGAQQEDSNQTTITNGTTASADNTASASGAAYVFKR